MTEASFDVIVVGGGLAGLATAALAGRRGLRPLVVEQGEAPGGTCAPVLRSGYRFDGAGHLLWGLEQGRGGGRLLAEVGVGAELLALEPGFQVALPRHRLGFFRADERFWREIRREFHDALAPLRDLDAQVEALDGALRGLDLGPGDLPPRTAWRRFQQWVRRSREETELERRGRGSLAELPAWQALPPEAQRALLLVLRYLGPADASSPLLLAAGLLGLRRHGFSALRGGAGSLAAALAQAVERHGGTLRTGVRAAEVVLRGRRAAGVRTDDGAVLTAPAVVLAVAPALLAGELLPGGARAFPGGTPAGGAAALTLYLGVDEAVLPAEMGPHLLIGLAEPILPGAIDRLSVQTSPPWDGGRAPRGRRALTVNAFVSLEGGLPPEADWIQVGERVLSALDDTLPGLRGRLDFCEVRTPVAWQRQTGRPQGAAAYAPGSLPVFLGWQGFPHATTVDALFVAGDWTFPGGGAADVLEGARRTLDLLAATRR